MAKPVLLHLGDDIRWNHDLYKTLQDRFEIKRSYSMGREEFKKALKEKRWGDFVAMYRPFWNTGGEMGTWDRELIELLPKSCKISASAGAGFDWVDAKTMAEHGIIYCNAAAACTESVADAAIMMILTTFRAFVWSSQAARSCSIPEFQNANRNIAAVTHNPNGFSLGIIGLGKIGYRIAQKASSAFEMKILYNDIRQMPIDIEQSVGAKYYPKLDDMLADADCVVIATPFAGNKLMDAPHFRMMKKGSRLVNIARGKLIDEPALVDALESGQLESAALDVHYDEPKVNEKLAKMQNVMLLSHTAGASVESHIGFERLGIENILSYFEKGQALTPVNMHWLKKDGEERAKL